MKKSFTKIFLLISFVCASSSVAAGVLMSEWTEGTNRFCKYSDGQVVAVSFGSSCPSTN